MKKIINSIMFCTFILMASSLAFAAEQAPQKVIDLANAKLVDIGTDPVVVAAVKAENIKGKTMDDIKAMDEKWMATPGIADFMEVLMSNECGKQLRVIQKSAPYFAEIFVTDNQGANVAMTDKTSDYWQGDEAKFKESFKNGKGGIHISDVEFDDSSQTYVVQVSFPVKDNENAIGTVTVSVDVDKIE